MKRVLVLMAVLALLVAGTVSVLADPIVVGGSFTTSSIEASTPGGGKGIPTHLGGVHVVGKPVPVEPSVMFSSPIVVGGS